MCPATSSRQPVSDFDPGSSRHLTNFSWTIDAQVKHLAEDYKAPQAEAPEHEIGTDPTVAHAAATEIDAGDVSAPVAAPVENATNGIANMQVTDDAANAVAESHWDNGNEASTISQEWVDVTIPKDPAETETGLTATPAAAANTQSWADDHPETVPAAAATPADPNDGFHQVQRNKGRNEREGGNHRGRGRGGWRGRGQGEGRGRGRGHRGGPRGGGGARRNEEA